MGTTHGAKNAHVTSILFLVPPFVCAARHIAADVIRYAEGQRLTNMQSAAMKLSLYGVEITDGDHGEGELAISDQGHTLRNLRFSEPSAPLVRRRTGNS